MPLKMSRMRFMAGSCPLRMHLNGKRSLNILIALKAIKRMFEIVTETSEI